MEKFLILMSETEVSDLRSLLLATGHNACPLGFRRASDFRPVEQNTLAGGLCRPLARAFCARLGVVGRTSLPVFASAAKQSLLRQTGMSILLMLTLAGPALAETEVSGAVSGEWTVEGSPFIVTDSTWVPEGDTLILRAGTEVKFNEGQGLYVWGRLNATGDEEDSVYIRVSEGVEHWRGLRFYGRNRTRWDYASIVCPDSAFVLDPGSSLTMNNCLVDADRTFAGDTNYGLRGCNLTFTQSVIRSRSHHTATGGRLTASHTQFDFGEDEDDEPGFWSPGTAFRLTSCEVIGGLAAEEGVVVADSCRFLRTPDGKPTGLGLGGIGGRMTESYVEGGVGMGAYNASYLFMNNHILGSLGIGFGSANVSGCDIGGLFRAQESDEIYTHNSLFRKSVHISFTESVIIDSCSLLSNDSTFHDLDLGYVHMAIVRRSILDTGIDLILVDSAFFDHNTIEIDSLHIIAAVNGGANSSSWTNNIIKLNVPSGRLFGQYEMPVFRYNCVWGFDIAAGPRYDPIPIEQIDSTNIINDPLIEWNGNIPYLTLESPCIDRGDPDFTIDIDSTRSDIGAYSFDQRLTVPEFINNNYLPYFFNACVFPNPFNNFLNISLSPVILPLTITLLDQTGRSVLYFSIWQSSSGIQTFPLNLRQLPSGNYFIFLRSGQYTKIIPVYCVK